MGEAAKPCKTYAGAGQGYNRNLVKFFLADMSTVPANAPPGGPGFFTLSHPGTTIQPAFLSSNPGLNSSTLVFLMQEITATDVYISDITLSETFYTFSLASGSSLTLVNVTFDSVFNGVTGDLA